MPPNHIQKQKRRKSGKRATVETEAPDVVGNATGIIL